MAVARPANRATLPEDQGALRQQLRPWLEPVALPRSVRRVAQMPVNAQGKRPWPQLKELFDAPLG